jgi:RNA polymerase sigma-70 factor (ECF subfamily)
VGVEKHYPEKHADGENGHAASVELRAVSGQVSIVDRGDDVGRSAKGCPPPQYVGQGAAGERVPSNDPPRASNIRSVTAAAPAVRLFAVPGLAPDARRNLASADAPDGATRAHLLVDEEGLLHRAAAGDATAFRDVFLRHRNDVTRLVYRMLAGSSDLEDVVQEVFVQVFRSLKDFRGQSKFSTWLHRVTVNVVLMHRRSARSRPVLTEELPGDLLADDRQARPDEELERFERMRAFERLLAKLADKKRIVFVLHELEGLPPSEIAEIVGAPILTVRTRLFYARRELEAMLADEPALENVAIADTGATP